MKILHVVERSVICHLLLLKVDNANRKFSYYRKYWLQIFLKIKNEPRKLILFLIFSAWFYCEVVTVLQKYRKSLVRMVVLNLITIKSG